MMNMSECPAMMNNIEMNFMPEIQSKCESSTCAGPKSFFRFDVTEKEIRILGKIPLGVSSLFFKQTIWNTVPLRISKLTDRITHLRNTQVGEIKSKPCDSISKSGQKKCTEKNAAVSIELTNSVVIGEDFLDSAVILLKLIFRLLKQCIVCVYRFQ